MHCQRTKVKQREIINALDVHLKRDQLSFEDWIEKNMIYIRSNTAGYVKRVGAKGVILGISGGLDSFVVGALLAGITDKDFKLTLVAMPKGEQDDFEDVLTSVAAIRSINPDVEFFEANIGPTVKAIHQTVNNTDSIITMTSTALGNVAARMRMVMQYALASNQLVVGTDHATEAVVGYYTKFGDGGSDFNPIGGFLKDDLYAMAKLLGAPEAILTKKPAAGLGISSSDEEELGLSYLEDIVPFLKGQEINKSKSNNIIQRYETSKHKREMPLTAINFKHPEPTKRTHVIIDCCNDFISGSLACQNAEKAVKNIIKEINHHPEDPVLYVQEKHPANHCSFKEQGGIWPAHCVEGTEGVNLHEDFYRCIYKDSNTPIKGFNIFNKGGNADKEQYSAFDASNPIHGSLASNCYATVVVSGIATEYCVKNTVNDFIDFGYHVIIIEKCLSFVDKCEHDKTLRELIDMGVTVIYN